MFWGATSFNGDISNWDVSKVQHMDNIFNQAAAFTQKLCGAAWVQSKATKDSMFEGSSGSISSTVCAPTDNTIVEATLAARRHMTHQTIPDRELKAHLLAAIFSTIASSRICPKCGTFAKSGRASCCAPDGAWYRNCGGAKNRDVDHRWIEGAKACERKFEAACM